jgi:hypothetical protein
MKYLKLIERKETELVLSLPLSNCAGCNLSMVNRRELPYYLQHEVRAKGVVIQAMDEGDYCDVCVGNGHFKKKCSLCETKKTYPTEFRFKLERNLINEYYTTHVCNECVEKSPQKIINLLAEADEITEYKSGNRSS